MIKINSNYNPDIHEHKYRYALCETVSGNLKLVELDKAWEKEPFINIERLTNDKEKKRGKSRL